MYQSSYTQRGQGPVAPREESPVSVIGAGIAARGRHCCRGGRRDVTLHERSRRAMTETGDFLLGATGPCPRWVYELWYIPVPSPA